MIYIEASTCDACGRCGRICPRYVVETIKTDDGKITRVVADRAGICIGCGQCMTICPTGSIRVEGIDSGDLRETPEVSCSAGQMMTVLEHRRSVRRYKKKAVDREVLDQVIEAVRWAPTSSSKGRLGVIVIDDPRKLEELSRRMFAFYAMVEGFLKNPVKRWFMARSAGKDKVDTLRHHAMPGIRWYARWYEEGRSEEITRNAPVVMLFHTPQEEPSGGESCVIASWQAVLVAETLGLGTCFNGLIPPPCNKVDEIHAMLGLPEGNTVHASLTMGWPKYAPASTIRRKLAEARYL
jgi:nitroreductase/NAD-dependent dihydropyrimidine dehydrogenase PreA subunit